MSVVHSEVSRIINQALTAVNRQSRFQSVNEAVESAWISVNSRRLRGDCGVNIAAAEHYLYCRFLIGRYSLVYIPILRTMSQGYIAAKALGLVDREGTCPHSPQSDADTAWKEQGMKDGNHDFRGMNRLGSLRAPNRPRIFLLPTRRLEREMQRRPSDPLVRPSGGFGAG